MKLFIFNLFLTIHLIASISALKFAPPPKDISEALKIIHRQGIEACNNQLCIQKCREAYEFEKNIQKIAKEFWRKQGIEIGDVLIE